MKKTVKYAYGKSIAEKSYKKNIMLYNGKLNNMQDHQTKKRLALIATHRNERQAKRLANVIRSIATPFLASFYATLSPAQRKEIKALL